MEKYEEASRDVIATLDVQPPSRSLQSNILYQGRLRYLNLLSRLTEQFVAVKKHLSDAVKTRKSCLKRNAIGKNGVFVELFAHPNSISVQYDE